MRVPAWMQGGPVRVRIGQALLLHASVTAARLLLWADSRSLPRSIKTGREFWLFVKREALDGPRNGVTGADWSRKAQVRGRPVNRL
jgi:hypothetical protein